MRHHCLLTLIGELHWYWEDLEWIYRPWRSTLQKKIYKNLQKLQPLTSLCDVSYKKHRSWVGCRPFSQAVMYEACLCWNGLHPPIGSQPLKVSCPLWGLENCGWTPVRTLEENLLDEAMLTCSLSHSVLKVKKTWHKL